MNDLVESELNDSYMPTLGGDPNPNPNPNPNPSPSPSPSPNPSQVRQIQRWYRGSRVRLKNYRWRVVGKLQKHWRMRALVSAARQKKRRAKRESKVATSARGCAPHLVRVRLGLP